MVSLRQLERQQAREKERKAEMIALQEEQSHLEYESGKVIPVWVE